MGEVGPHHMCLASCFALVSAAGRPKDEKRTLDLLFPGPLLTMYKSGIGCISGGAVAGTRAQKGAPQRRRTGKGRLWARSHSKTAANRPAALLRGRSAPAQRLFADGRTLFRDGRCVCDRRATVARPSRDGRGPLRAPCDARATVARRSLPPESAQKRLGAQPRAGAHARARIDKTWQQLPCQSRPAATFRGSAAPLCRWSRAFCGATIPRCIQFLLPHALIHSARCPSDPAGRTAQGTYGPGGGGNTRGKLAKKNNAARLENLKSMILVVCFAQNSEEYNI